MSSSEFENTLSDLKKNIEGDVLVSYADRIKYATDESIFHLLPAFIVAPKNENDVIVTMNIASKYHTSVTCRGGGTGVAGQSIGSGIILDMKKYLSRIVEVSSDTAVVQPGVVLKDLNAELSKHGRRFAPDPGSWMTCTIGGMVSTNASGPHGFMHGSTREHVLDQSVVLADGHFAKASTLTDRFSGLVSNMKANKHRIEKHWPLVRKNSSGYALLELSKDHPDFARFLCGTDGTLAVTTEINVRTIPLAQKCVLAIYPFKQMKEAVEFVPQLRTLKPAAIELLDEHILSALENANSGILEALGLSGSLASLWVEWEGDMPESLNQPRPFITTDASGRSNLWSIRSKASRYLHEQAKTRHPLRCIEDTAVPVQHVGNYIEELKNILLKHDCEGAIFGHIGDGHLHVNPNIDVTQPRLWSKIERLMNEVYELVGTYGGTISGEHGDGILRSNYVQQQWRPLVDLLVDVKDTFDPQHILNPGKKLSKRLVVHPPLKRFH